MITVKRPEVHDLLELRGAAGARFDGEPPDWALGRILDTRWLVVRRALPAPGWHAAGLRGQLRSERCAVWISELAVSCAISPQEITVREAWVHHPRASRQPAFRVLPSVASIMRRYDLDTAWGPAGSVGLELASGNPWVSALSDLDIVLKAERPLSKQFAAAIFEELCRLPVRVDLLLETPLGGLALADWANPETDNVLIRTPLGPRLTGDPWDLPIDRAAV